MEHDPHNAQNWCSDPFGLHQARWFSNGIPTALVRDDGVESQDPPPETVVERRYELPSIEPREPVRAEQRHRFRRNHSRVRTG
jgi:hypothetical protein